MKAARKHSWFDPDDVMPGDLVSLNGLVLEPSGSGRLLDVPVTFCADHGMGVAVWLGGGMVLSSLGGGSLMKIVKRGALRVTDVLVVLGA